MRDPRRWVPSCPTFLLFPQREQPGEAGVKKLPERIQEQPFPPEGGPEYVVSRLRDDIARKVERRFARFLDTWRQNVARYRDEELSRYTSAETENRPKLVGEFARRE